MEFVRVVNVGNIIFKQLDKYPGFKPHHQT